MPTRIHEILMAYIRENRVEFRELEHLACVTSAESAAARASAGAPGSVGAKALILKGLGDDNFAMTVIPGFSRLCSSAIRVELGKFRFANPGEVAAVTGGLEPGMIPPFGSPVFPMIRMLIVDEQLAREPLIGFNAAMFEKSVVMSGRAYLSLVPNAVLRPISEEYIAS